MAIEPGVSSVHGAPSETTGPSPAAQARMPPRATYRLQLRGRFGFDDARGIVPYLASLGVSHVYASPLLEARPGSPHGYDIVDHRRLNPEIGTEEEFKALVRELHAHGMGILVDFVPNHMGIGPDNPWWMDVLEWGRASRFAGFFDIDWQSADPALEGKILLPFLGDHYGSVLERGEIRLRFDAERGAFAFTYFDLEFPLSPADYPRILEGGAEAAETGTAGEALERLADRFRDAVRIMAAGGMGAEAGEPGAEAGRAKTGLAQLVHENPEIERSIGSAVQALNGTPGEPESFEGLHHLLETQAYRLAFWRIAAHEINYRRFFDNNDLAGLRMENPDLFEAAHELLGRLIREGSVDGVRLDHIDGLRDPQDYLDRLQELGSDDGSLYVLVEKILAPPECLRTDWPVAGTTGYDFLREGNALFVDPAGGPPLVRTYRRFSGRSADYEEEVAAAKRKTVRESLSAEMNVLANLVNRIAKQSRRTRDYSFNALHQALTDVVAHFCVYRTYGDERQGFSPDDRKELAYAVRRARSGSGAADLSVFGFVYDVLTLDLLGSEQPEYRRADVVDAALRFQQYTGPVMAKAAEDTAFYRYVPLVSLNEVGGEPDVFGEGPAAFHHAAQRRLREHPAALLATATHDHKRGEDVRARLNVLSEVPGEWAQRVRRWARESGGLKTELEDGPAPSGGDEYLLYQTVVGAWPFGLEPDDSSRLAEFRARLDGYMQKAAREAKLRTSWVAPDDEYEAALSEFVRGLLDPSRSGSILEDIAGWVARIAPAGAVNSLAQTVLKLTAPGVPDIYQGTELWDQSLVDPDNRRPVDYDLRRTWLNQGSDTDDLLRSWRDGRVKQRVIAAVLDVRRRVPALFSDGRYQVLGTGGRWGEHVVAYARCEEPDSVPYLGALVVAIVPRLAWPLLEGADLPLPSGWEDTSVRLPEEWSGLVFRDAVTGRRHGAGAAARLDVAAVLGGLPVSVLVKEE